MRTRTRSIVAGLVLVAGLLGGVAWATIPGADGTIQGCYTTSNGNLRVVNSANECRNSETAISWNQRGQTGAAGVNGTNGQDGATGAKGDPGPQGPQGEPGVAGTNGATGAAGATGPVGPAGSAGTPGVKGDTGAAGANGVDGTDGVDGANGTNGSNGIDGAKGDTGDTGPAGTNGTNGTDGAPGAPGPKGDTGKSGAPGAGLSTVQATASVTTPAGVARSAIAPCPSTHPSVVGGGFGFLEELVPYLTVLESHATADGSGWFVRLHNSGGQFALTFSATVYATCAG